MKISKRTRDRAAMLLEISASTPDNWHLETVAEDMGWRDAQAVKLAYAATESVSGTDACRYFTFEEVDALAAQLLREGSYP